MLYLHYGALISRATKDREVVWGQPTGSLTRYLGHRGQEGSIGTGHVPETPIDLPKTVTHTVLDARVATHHKRLSR